MKKKRILVVDDEADLLDIVKEWLKEEYEVATAVNGFEGLRLAKEFKPNLIILDITMPKMDGFEVLAQLRGQLETNLIPVIMLTAQGRSENILEAEELRATDFLIKPFDPDDLLTVVRNTLK